mgnify:CR=1 FL=1
MSLRIPIVEDWKEKFQHTFKFHPDRDAIMDRILSEEPISVGQLDKWFREADECADFELQKHLQDEAA